jgi:hypothetical protein
MQPTKNLALPSRKMCAGSVRYGFSDAHVDSRCARRGPVAATASASGVLERREYSSSGRALEQPSELMAPLGGKTALRYPCRATIPDPLKVRDVIQHRELLGILEPLCFENIRANRKGIEK